LASCRFIEEKVSILIVGPCGTGKSHIAQALGHCAIRAGYDVLFTTVSKMLAQMNAARAHNAFDRHFAKLAAVDLLIIDDFGLKPLQGSQDEDFHDVIAERYERRSTIVTSNLLCGAPHKRFNAELIVMRRGVSREPTITQLFQ
jgi:DNA replication protein DnaC